MRFGSNSGDGSRNIKKAFTIRLFLGVRTISLKIVINEMLFLDLREGIFLPVHIVKLLPQQR